jgi:cyclopropane fatty-acyl-phospholipid synthase-like methyltransferase
MPKQKLECAYIISKFKYHKELKQNLLDLLEKFVKIFNVKTILDIGCGDFNWMKHFNFKLIDHYVGVDIVEQLNK